MSPRNSYPSPRNSYRTPSRKKTPAQQLVDSGAFERLSPERKVETMLHVYWSTFDPNKTCSIETGNTHVLRHGTVTADLGLDAPPDPPFTREEMEQIMFAAKIAVIKVLRKRVNVAHAARKTKR